MIISQKGLMIAAPHSGSGKTVVTLALLRAFKMQGIEISGAKGGPDYIDPQFHALACGTSSVNLDPWAMSTDRCRQLASRQPGSHLLIESMMGLFDGAADGTGSGATLAKSLNVPVLLVVDAGRQSHSVGALVRGFCDHDSEVEICGVILNRVGSPRHERMLRQALEGIEMSVVGVIGRNEKLGLPDRHLGLVQAGELEQIEEFIRNAAEEIAAGCDLAHIETYFKELSPSANKTKCIPPPGQNIAVARDLAFSFIYPHLLQDWRDAGAQVSEFSPLANEGPPIDADAVFLPGGYPELHGARIATASGFFHAMRLAKDRGAMIYGECGGYMVLGNGLIDGEGKRHRMLGLLDVETSFEKRRLRLGYRNATANGGFFASSSIRAHEFHYSTVVRENGEPLFTTCDVLGEQNQQHGLRDGNVMGSYLHLIDVGET